MKVYVFCNMLSGVELLENRGFSLQDLQDLDFF